MSRKICVVLYHNFANHLQPFEAESYLPR